MSPVYIPYIPVVGVGHSLVRAVQMPGTGIPVAVKNLPQRCFVDIAHSLCVDAMRFVLL